MHTSRFSVVAGLLVSCSLPLHAAGVEDLPAALRSAGFEAGVVSGLEADGPLAAALEGKRQRVVEEVADGLVAAVYEDGAGTVVVLVSAGAAPGTYLLPGGERLRFRDAAGEPLTPGSVLDEAVAYAESGLAWEGLQYYARLAPANPGEVNVTGADVDESVDFVVVAVGDGDNAVPTLEAGLAEARRLLADGEHVRVEVHPGVYREGNLSMPGNGALPDAPTLVIEGVGDGEVVLTGADDFSGGWTELADDPGVYEKPWPHRFGMGGQPWARWGFMLPPEACRAEVLTIDGQLLLPVMLEQFTWSDPDGVVKLDELGAENDVPGSWKPAGVRSPGDLVEGTYGVVEAEGRVFLRPPAGVDPASAVVEAGVRRELLTLQDRSNLVLRNLVFRHSVNHPGGSFDGARQKAVALNGRNFLVEGCVFEEHGAFSLDLGREPTDVTVRGNRFLANGWNGLSGGYLPANVLYEDNEASSNNWRGHMGGEHSWDAAAVKVFGINSARGIAIRGHRGFANLTHGFWLDQSFTPYAPVEISDSVFKGNLFGAELYLEKLTGPVEVDRNVVWNSHGLYGVNGTSWNLHFRDNLMGAEGDRPVWFLHRRGDESDYANFSRDWLVENNVVAAGGAKSVFYKQESEPEQYAEFVKSYAAGGNRYLVAEGAEPFVGPDDEPIGFEAWAELTGQEEASTEEVFSGYEVSNHPLALSVEDQRAYEAAMSRTERFLAVANAVEPASGPPFERATQAVGNNLVQLDLAGLANRALVGGDAWIGGGNQLPQLGGGRHDFAGVPFDVLDPSGGGDAALSLRSGKIPGAGSADLPVGERVEAVYVLHGAGWVNDTRDAVGRYELVFADGETHGLDVKVNAAGVGQPLVGDWYPAFQPFDNEVARHAKLRAGTDGIGANLYVVEIANPHPKKEVAAVRFTGNPDRDPSLVILGVTVLLR